MSWDCLGVRWDGETKLAQDLSIISSVSCKRRNSSSTSENRSWWWHHSTTFLSEKCFSLGKYDTKGISSCEIIWSKFLNATPESINNWTKASSVLYAINKINKIMKGVAKKISRRKRHKCRFRRNSPPKSAEPFCQSFNRETLRLCNCWCWRSFLTNKYWKINKKSRAIQ